MTFTTARRIHRTATAIVGVMGVIHSILTATSYSGWTASALWFLGAGLGLVLIALMNWAHVGLEPCSLPTAKAVKWANVGYGAFGIAAVFAVAEPHALLLVAALVVHAIDGFWTLDPQPASV